MGLLLQKARKAMEQAKSLIKTIMILTFAVAALFPSTAWADAAPQIGGRIYTEADRLAGVAATVIAIIAVAVIAAIILIKILKKRQAVSNNAFNEIEDDYLTQDSQNANSSGISTVILEREKNDETN